MVGSDERAAAEHQPRRYVCASAEEPCCGVVSRPAAQIEQLATDAYLRHLGAVDDDEAAAFAEKVNGRGGQSLPGGRRVAFRP